MKRFILFLISILPCLNSFLHAEQSKTDSLSILITKDKADTNKAIHLYKLSQEFCVTGRYDSALYYANTALQLSKQLDFKSGIAMSNNTIGVIYFSQGNYPESLKYSLISLEIRKEIGNKRDIATSYNNIGNVYAIQGNYPEGLKNYFISLKIRESIGDKRGIAMSYNNIGLIYSYQGNYTESLKNYLASLQIRKEIDDKYEIVTSYNNIGNIYSSQGNYPEALKNYSSAIQIGEEIDNKEGVATSCNNIGMIYYLQNNYPEALKKHFTSLKIGEEIGDKEGMTHSYINIGRVYSKQNNTKEALAYLNKALSLSKEIGSKNVIKYSYEGLTEAYEKAATEQSGSVDSNWEKAFNSYKLFIIYRDSMFNDESVKKIAEINAKYETEKKEKEIEIQSHKLSEQGLLLSRNRLWITFLSISFLLLIILGWAAFSRYKIKKESQIKSQMLRDQEGLTKAIINTQEEERTRIARDLHDGIGQTLAGVIANYEQLNPEINNFSEKKQEQFRQTAKSLDEAYKELRAISHLMMPRALKIAGLASTISDLLDKTLANTSVAYGFENKNSESIPENISIGIYRIFQELLGNILKHSKADKISVSLLNNQSQLILIVDDNGIGIPQNKIDHKNTGVGLMNIIARAQALQGTFIVEPANMNGTVATVIIPLPQP